MKQKIIASMGKVKSDIVFKNANVVNVFTNEIVKADVAVLQDTIVGIGTYNGKIEIDCTDKFICSGFIDAHMHIESTMVMPLEFARAVMKSGTTTVIADPHEIVNVLGKQGFDFMLDASNNIPLSVYLMLPSSVPSTLFETNGSDFTKNDMVEFINNDRVLGLGEVMCFPDVINAQNEILEKIKLNKHKVIDGHAPGINSYDLQAYITAGVMTDHECSTFNEAYEKVKAGMKILVREGSAAKNCEAIIRPLSSVNIPIDNFLLCTDDKHLDDIRREGHIRWSIKKAIDCGLTPIEAIKMATINVARTYNLKAVGAIAPGYKADIVILDDLENVIVNSVYKNGTKISNKLFDNIPQYKINRKILNTVHIKDILSKDISLKSNGINDIIEIIPNQILTKHLKGKIPIEYDNKNKVNIFKPNQEYNKLCVIERHRNTGNIKVVPLKGFNLKNAAIATTVAHDSHNIIVAGDNDLDIIIAVNRINKIQGGYVIASNGKVLLELELSVAGLISTKSADEVEKISGKMIELSRKLGINNDTDPFLTLSFLSLPVIPEIRLTDYGLVSIKDSIKLI